MPDTVVSGAIAIGPRASVELGEHNQQSAIECAQAPRMRPRPSIAVITPALKEEKSIGHVLQAIPCEWADEVIVVDNGSARSR